MSLLTLLGAQFSVGGVPWQCRETCIHNQSRCLLLAICMPWAPLRCLRPRRPHLMTKVWHRSSFLELSIQPNTAWKVDQGTTLSAVNPLAVVFTWQLPAVPSWIHKSSIQTKGPFMSCSKAARILALQHFRVENWNGLAWRSYVIWFISFPLGGTIKDNFARYLTVIKASSGLR